MGYHGNIKILLPWGVPIHRVFYSVLFPHCYGFRHLFLEPAMHADSLSVDLPAQQLILRYINAFGRTIK